MKQGMRGSIQKKGPTYYAVVAINGKRKWFSGGPTKKDAQRVLSERLGEIDDGTYKELPKITFAAFSELWLKNYAEAHVKPSTLAGYKHIIKQNLIPVFGSHKLSDITARPLQSYVAVRLSKISPKTACNEVVVIKEMFKHAYRWEYLKSNPAEHLERPKVTKSEIEILAPEEVKKLLSIPTGHYRTAFLTDVQTGLRAGELWGLKWPDIDWNAKQLHVKRSLWKGEFQTPKSKTSIRKIDLPDSLMQELRIWKLACPANEDNLIFPSTEGKTTCHDNAVKRHFNPALKKAGLGHVSFHSLRHTNASMRIQAGQNIKYIQTQLGHASINITLDTYGHMFNDSNFNRGQVALFETTFAGGLLEKPFEPVRKPLETHLKLVSNDAVESSFITPSQVAVGA